MFTLNVQCRYTTLHTYGRKSTDYWALTDFFGDKEALGHKKERLKIVKPNTLTTLKDARLSKKWHDNAKTITSKDRSVFSASTK